MTSSHTEAIIYSCKAATAAAVAAICYSQLDLPGSQWVAAVSAVVVTQTDLHASWKASLLRVAANLVGALFGLLFLDLLGQALVAMVLGIIVTGWICHVLKEDDAMRPAFVAVILVTLVGGSSKWQYGADRVIGVIIGCLCALVVGWLFDKVSSLALSTKKDVKPGPQE